MNFPAPLSRALALGLLIVGAAALPAHAAPADVSLLKSYIGDWRGRGTVTGANSETVVCRLSLKPGNQDKVNYTGRCTVAGSQLSMNGTIAYVEASKRYEAAMTSNVAFTGIAVGQKRGGGLIFNLQRARPRRRRQGNRHQRADRAHAPSHRCQFRGDVYRDGRISARRSAVQQVSATNAVAAAAGRFNPACCIHGQLTHRLPYSQSTDSGNWQVSPRAV
ncbi:hypothetical protein N8D56_18345 [Devosia sp. A8/3-2]|nr:hypothetical protein N8D56_18345 [Devosia sp. A8/3-2]